MKILCLLGVVATLTAAAFAAKPPEVELFTEGGALSPASTVEVRFSRPMVPPEQLGVPVAEAPLIFTPALPGRFTWLSTRSGVYAPSAPPLLGTSYRVTLRAGLADAGGVAVAAGFAKVLKTPPFQISLAVEEGRPDASVPHLPDLKIAFNLNVKLESAEKAFEFVSDDGRKVAAEVRYATTAHQFDLPAEAEDWHERWQLAHAAAGAEKKEDEDEEHPRPNRLFVSAAASLAPGPIWRLEMKPGIESVVGGHRIAERRVTVLGRVTPFSLKKLEAASYLNSGRSVVLKFSDDFAPDVDESTAAKFFRITPAPPNLRFEEGSEEITIRGDFERGVEYRLEIDPSLLSIWQQPFTGERSRPFRFAPVKPRIYLPAITADQLRGGDRKFPIRAVNLQSVRITARLVAPEAAAQAIAAFKKYEKKNTGYEHTPTEPYQQIAPGLIKATPLAERTVELPGAVLDARQETVVDWSELLGGQKAGLIFLTVEGRPLADAATGRTRPSAQALIQLTDLGVLWKTADRRLRTTVFSLATGQPLAGASVAMLKKDFTAVLASSTTDADGAVSLPLKNEIGWLVVRKAGDVHAMRMGEEAEELPMSRFNLPIYYSGWSVEEAAKPRLRGLLFTDRPLYRPGETVRVKGIVRRVTDRGVKLDPAKDGVVTLHYPREGGSQEIKVRTDERGAFDASFELPPGKVGTFRLNAGFAAAKPGEASGELYESFQVQEFQPNAFETRIAMPERFAPDQKVSAAVSASYLFGSPVSDARVQWTLQYVPERFSASGFGGFVFGDDSAPDQKSLTLRGEWKLAPTATIEPQLPRMAGERFRGLLTIEVTDQNQQTVSESRGFSRESSSFYIGIAEADRRVIGHAEEFTAAAVAVRPDGTPMPAPVAVKAELVRIEYETVRVQAAGKGVSFHTETREKVIATADGATLVPVREDGVWRAPDGETARFKPGAAGEYLLRLTAQDEAGRTARASYSFTVSGTEAMAWDYRNPAQIDLKADKTEYRAGDTARILLKTPISGDAWVSVERGDSILRSMRVKLEGNAPTIEIPLDAADAPNVFVSVVLLRGAEQSTRKFKTADFRYGVCRLRIANPMTRLQVAVTPARLDVQPGEEVETEVRVLDAQGAPVADAEVTFFAVDDGILALTGYERPQPGGIFDALSPLNVRTGLTLFDLLPEDPSDITYANKGYLIGGGGIEGPSLKLRRDFPGTAAWLPALRTDRDGRVKPRFTAPDALTRYRLVAVAHAGDDRFGSAESAVGIRQPFMLLSALGQIANVGDELVARAVLRNETGATGIAEVSLELDGTAQAAGAALTASFAMKKDETRTVEFPVKFVKMGDATWKWSAKLAQNGGEFRDGLVSTLKVGSPVPVLRETYLTELDEKANDLLAGVNPQLLEGEGAVAVTLANTRLATLGESANQLLTYPYGCAEQLVSGLIPWIVIKNLGPVLGDFGQDPKQVQKAISAGTEKVFALQTPSGGLAYWPGGREDSLFASAWAVVAFGELAKQDFPLPAGWDRLLRYLSQELREIDKVRVGDELDQFALAVFALASAGRPEPAYYEKLAARRGELTHEGRALLALAIIESKGASAFAEGLLNPDLPAPEAASWFGSATRERAVGLMAWTRLKPKHREVGRLTKELLASRAGGHWRTTQENAWALLALSRYFALVEREVKPVAGTIAHNGRGVPFQLTKKKLSETSGFSFDAAQPLGALAVANPAGAPLYGEARFIVRPRVAEQPRQDRGYAVSRSYRKIAADGSLADAADLQVGDRVVVTLRVETTRPGHFVAIDDPLPAILEALNPEFRTQQAGAGAQGFWQSDYREVRADRVLYFCDHLAAGAYTFSYLARVRTAGRVTAPATKVEEMYRPERFGLSETTQLTSRATK